MKDRLKSSLTEAMTDDRLKKILTDAKPSLPPLPRTRPKNNNWKNHVTGAEAISPTSLRTTTNINGGNSVIGVKTSPGTSTTPTAIANDKKKCSPTGAKASPGTSTTSTVNVPKTVCFPSSRMSKAVVPSKPNLDKNRKTPRAFSLPESRYNEKFLDLESLTKSTVSGTNSTSRTVSGNSSKYTDSSSSTTRRYH